MNTKIGSLAVVIACLSSCGDSITVTEQKEVKESSAAADVQSEKELDAEYSEVSRQEELREKEELASLTTISFNESVAIGNFKQSYCGYSFKAYFLKPQ